MLKHISGVINRFFQRGSSGLTMIELLIVAAILGVLMVILLLVYQTQLGRSRDARRKADLEKIRVAFEEYYNDHGCYPPPEILDNCGGPELQPYLDKVPCDPFTGEPYLYVPDPNNQCKGYRLLTVLEDNSDPAIVKVGCGGPTLCGFGSYNWGVSSGIPIGIGIGGSGGSGSGFSCDPQGICNLYQDPGAAGCPLVFSDSTCESRCTNPATWCNQ